MVVEKRRGTRTCALRRMISPNDAVDLTKRIEDRARRVAVQSRYQLPALAPEGSTTRSCQMIKRSICSTLLFALPLLLAACQPTPGAMQAGLATLRLDTPVSGEVTTAGRINYNDGSRSVAYEIELGDDQAISLETKGALCARLLVMFDGETVAGPVDAPSCGDANNESRLSLLAPEAGRYTVAVSGVGGRSYGPFRLEAKALQVRTGNEPLQPDVEIVDFMQDDNRKRYQVEISEPGYYVLEMRSSDVDSALELQGNGVSVSDDDGGDGLDSRIRVSLQPGVYTLHAKAVNDKAGMFRLSVSTGALPDGVQLQNEGSLMADGTVVYGTLVGSPREYTLAIAQPSRIELDLRSDDFDAVLELRGNGISREDDDGGSGTDSRISTVLQPGEYRVVARGLGGNATGLFQLTATQRPMPEGAALRTGGTLVLDTPVSGLLEGEGHTYQLEVARRGELVVDLTSDDFDAMLELHRDGALVASDDDGGTGTNSRLQADVAPGRYMIKALAYHGAHGIRGMYELTARLGSVSSAAGVVDQP
ncbi:hypothetical protein E2F46_01775 [Luteimonas aestuarii]|uniref:ABC transporter substrate-binding protein n=1 Tax=Luteimonas aestuarii TaxID=453837 RepID=A0A4V3AMZ5_9GAMM|nr:hypothetical protein [Luteimonas aestuarii]TDK28635.1 hypothetical protein E2F46_01775 [Luteimonas aestuarii]